MRSKKTILWISVLLLLAGITLYPTPEIQPIQYIDRQTGEVMVEKVAGQKWLAWLYHNPAGQLSLHALVKRKLISTWYGNRMDSPGSADKIGPFVEEYGIDLDIAKKDTFSSFNDFFTRELKLGARPINADTNVVVSPADCKILAYEDIGNMDFLVKGYRFDVAAFLQDTVLAKKYENGSLLLARLCPADYHRFHFPVSGRVSEPVRIEGDLYSVNPIALREIVEVFCLNKREYVTIATAEFGDVIMAEVGATMVGSIVQTYAGNTAVKGMKKGFFKFGGSTVILLFEKGKVQIDEDLLRNTERQLETEVKVGERVAVGRGQLAVGSWQ